MLTTLLAVNAVSLVAVLAFARWNTVCLDDAGRLRAAATESWEQAVVPAVTDAARV